MAGTTQLEAGGGDGEYTQDGTTDLHGNPILRSKRGGWRACSFVVGTCVPIQASVLYLLAVFSSLAKSFASPVQFMRCPTPAS
jgi:hypothetical protein